MSEIERLKNEPALQGALYAQPEQQSARAVTDAPSIIGSMAAIYGMDRRAFEATLRNTIMPNNTTNEQCAAFLLVAKQHNLNPFTKEIFAFPNRGGIQPVVSVDGWMKLINSHPQFDGMDFSDGLDSDGVLRSVTCKIYRKDRAHPVCVTEYMSECKRPTETWKQWPARMLRHKAAIQAARYAFSFAGIMEPDEYERMQSAHVDDVPEVTIVDTRNQRHDDAVEQYDESISAIKAELAKDDPDLWAVKEMWDEIPQSAKLDLWLAPTKGGVFTTSERKAIKDGPPKVPQVDQDTGEMLPTHLQ